VASGEGVAFRAAVLMSEGAKPRTMVMMVQIAIPM
jgi:hypothetical protein